MARLLALGVRTIILDEPTTGISAPQKELLFEILHRLAGEGLSVVFVSHKLEEIEALCSRATILRQGKVAGEATAPFDQGDLVRKMFGQELSDYPRSVVPLGQPVLELADVSIHSRRLSLEGLAIEVRGGEVLGLAGLEGSGQQLLMQSCAGLVPIDSGHLALEGRDMRHARYADFCQAGVAYIPAARLENGMIGEMTLLEHFALVSKRSGALVDWSGAADRAAQAVSEFSIVGQPQTRVVELSGGNQQRALLGLLPENISLLLLEHPTRGLDVESSRWVWSRLLQRRIDGTAIIFTSTDLDELVENSDRIVVFSAGRMSMPLPVSDVTVEQLGYLIGGSGL
jgi:simple sugar transport system ATP-binding protein